MPRASQVEEVQVLLQGGAAPRGGPMALGPLPAGDKVVLGGAWQQSKVMTISGQQSKAMTISGQQSKGKLVDRQLSVMTLPSRRLPSTRQSDTHD